MRWIIGAAIAAATIFAGAAGLELLNLTVRPPQPLGFGTVQWFDETGVTVDGVRRARRLELGGRTYAAAGEFYLVRARVLCPFGERYHWDDGRVRVETFAGVGGSGRHASFAIDEPVQRALDRQTGRPGPKHEVRGAVQGEELVFDLPRDVEQPGLVFLDANDPIGALGLLFGRVWAPHRFNLRLD